MTKSSRSWKSQLFMCFAGVALFATACGGGGGGGSGSGRTSEEVSAAVATAEQNEASLSLSSDLAASGLYDTHTGEITNLSEVVTGDRPILVWYWAPH